MGAYVLTNESGEWVIDASRPTVFIVGAGPVGLTIANQVKRLHSAAEIVVLEAASEQTHLERSRFLHVRLEQLALLRDATGVDLETVDGVTNLFELNPGAHSTHTVHGRRKNAGDPGRSLTLELAPDENGGIMANASAANMRSARLEHLSDVADFATELLGSPLDKFAAVTTGPSVARMPIGVLVRTLTTAAKEKQIPVLYQHAARQFGRPLQASSGADIWLSTPAGDRRIHADMVVLSEGAGKVPVVHNSGISRAAPSIYGYRRLLLATYELDTNANNSPKHDEERRARFYVTAPSIANSTPLDLPINAGTEHTEARGTLTVRDNTIDLKLPVINSFSTYSDAQLQAWARTLDISSLRIDPRGPDKLDGFEFRLARSSDGMPICSAHVRPLALTRVDGRSIIPLNTLDNYDNGFVLAAGDRVRRLTPTGIGAGAGSLNSGLASAELLANAIVENLQDMQAGTVRMDDRPCGNRNRYKRVPRAFVAMQQETLRGGAKLFAKWLGPDIVRVSGPSASPETNQYADAE